MSPPATSPPPARSELVLAVLLFVAALGFHGWSMSVGWKHGNMPGNEFRQTQTALSALFIQRDGDFSLAYPTPVLGQPWSVPMEFPLYQWTVAVTSNVTGLALTQAGRAVSIACFYAALGALFPLLGALRLPPARRLVVLSLVLTSPLYVFYARSFLIEMMVLMFSLWFLVAFGRMITAPTWGRLLLATALGVPAGLVKVTTFAVFLLPAAFWTVVEMRRQHAAGGLAAAARRGAWAVGALVLPFALTLGWTRFADGVKQQNSSAGFLKSGRLMDFNFGTGDNRFSAETLASHWHNLAQNLAGPVLLAVAGLLALTLSRRWWREIALCLGCYLATLAIFPTLYAWHDYYGVANGVLLLSAVGVAVAGALDARIRWLPWGLLLALQATQIWTYHQRYYEMQWSLSAGGNDMTRAIRAMTDPDETIIVTGQDWDSSMPFYSERRALMVRNGMERDRGYLESAFAAQAADRVALLVVRNAPEQDVELLKLATRHFDIDPRPLFRWENHTVFGRRALRDRMIGAVRKETKLVEVKLDETTQVAVWSLTDREMRTADLLQRDQAMFAGFSPRPVKFYAQYGTYATNEEGRPALFAHPALHLWFRVPAGRRVMRVPCALQAAAYAGAVQDRTDGVEFVVERERADGTRERLGALVLDPAKKPADAGWHVLEVSGDFAAETTLVLSTGPGPGGSFSRDWALLGAVTIE